MSSNVTLKQIADALDISTMTVSRALNNRANVDTKTKQRVEDMARKMGTRQIILPKVWFPVRLILSELLFPKSATRSFRKWFEVLRRSPIMQIISYF